MFPPSRPFVEGVGWLVKHVVFRLGRNVEEYVVV